MHCSPSSTIDEIDERTCCEGESAPSRGREVDVTGDTGHAFCVDVLSPSSQARGVACSCDGAVGACACFPNTLRKNRFDVEIIEAQPVLTTVQIADALAET